MSATFEYIVQKDGLIVIRWRENKNPFCFTYHLDHARMIVNALNYEPETVEKVFE